MRSSYAFSAGGACLQTQIELEARCVFFDGRTDIVSLEFFDELELALKLSDTLPDLVVVLASGSVVDKLRQFWHADSSERDRFISRGTRDGIQYVKAYYFVAWDPQGAVERESVNGRGSDAEWTIPIAAFIKQGLQDLVRRNPVVQLAPAGHVFKHPSGTINKVFIQARELATDEPQLAFVGRALWQVCAAGVEGDVTAVYVDTMSIYPFVREALTFSGSLARINSFHSYGAIAEMSAPGESYLVVISASTSGGMARRLCRDQGFEALRLVTLIDTSTNGRSGAVLVALDQVDTVYREHLTDENETEIELVGEHFSSKAKPPRAITLGIPHTPANLLTVLTEFGIGGTHPINFTPPERAGPQTVSLVVDSVPNSKKFQTWLAEEIGWSLSIAVDHIVYVDDSGSLAMANQAATLIAERKGQPPKVICYNELITKGLAGANGVLVIAAVAGDGGVLREISRDLRELVVPKLPRHFLVGVCLPQSLEALDRLAQFLVRNSTHRNYGFSRWLTLPVGPDNSNNAWNAYISLAGQAEISPPQLGAIPAEIVNQSLELLSASVHAGYNGFLSKTDGSALSLSDGFLFFGNVFNGQLERITPSTTFLAVASVLQTARDLKSAANQLRPTGYESVVLAPENFLRFNDNMLQACILRGAHVSELDYSTSPHLSSIMKEFLLKVFERHEHTFGAAALEFAAALAAGRIKLKKVHAEEVVNRTIQHLRYSPSALLGFMLMVD